MIDLSYNEHFDFDDDAFKKNYQVGDVFRTLSHEFTFLGTGKIDHGAEPYLDLNIFLVKDPSGGEQYVGSVASGPKSSDDFDDLVRILEYSYPDVEFTWLNDLDNPETTLIPLESIETMGNDTYLCLPELSIFEHKWVSVDSRKHVTRLGGYPSFGDAKEYGQPHGKNAEGEWKPLPFIAQVILPNGKFVHIYHVDDPEGNSNDTDQYLLGFDIESPYRSLVLVQDSEIPAGFCLMPVADSGRSIVREEAVEVEDGRWPKATFYIQGPETDEEFPYTLFHLPSQYGYGEDQDKMLTYAETYIIWDGKKKAKLVEQYD